MNVKYILLSIINYITRSVKMNKKDYTGYGEGLDFIPHWGIIIPHTEKRPGALSFDGRYSEYVYAGIMSTKIGLPLYHANSPESLAETFKHLGVNASIEPHFNAFNGGVKGAEILVLHNDIKSEYFARLFMEYFVEKYPTRKLRHGNGIKYLKHGDRGFRNLNKAKSSGMKVAVLSELFFGDNGEDWLSPEDQAVFWRECVGSMEDI